MTMDLEQAKAAIDLRIRETFHIPPGHPKDWPAGEALDEVILADGFGHLTLRADPNDRECISTDMMAAINHLSVMAENYKRVRKGDFCWRIAYQEHTYYCEYNYSPGESEDQSGEFECEGEGGSLALAIAHALADYRDWPGVDSVEVWWYEHGGDAELEESVPFVIDEPVPA